MSSRLPIVVILGATGTGKSKLAIQIAKKFNGEIISADSIQVYRGLDIASNKVTEEERAQIPHHMIDICKPTDRFSVMDYKNRTLPIINEIQNRKRLPIIVGGTSYYVESILWHTLFEEPSNEEDELTFDRVRVTKNCENTTANAWWYKRDNASNCHTDSFEFPFESSAQPTVEKLIDSIEILRRQFRESIRQIEERIAISSELFGRTFYRITNADEEESEDEDGNTDESGQSDVEFEVECVADAETTLLNKFLHDWIEKAIKTANNGVELLDQQLDYIWNKRTAWSILNGSKRLKESGWNAKTDANRIQAQYGDQQLEVLSQLINDMRRIIKIRVKRLNLLKILDDVNMDEYSTEELYEELKLVDEEITESLHPNNRRKIIRAIQIYFDTGEKYTRLVQNVRETDGASAVSPPLRYPDVCILWLQCDQIVLNQRLNKRVEEMIENGLIVELENFHKAYNAERLKNQDYENCDYSKGIFQLIGLKEFHTYLMLSNEQKCSSLGKALLQKGVTKLKVTTQRYSKNQWRFVMNKFISVPQSKKVPPIFALECTDLNKWDEMVEAKAYSLVDHYLNSGNMYEAKYEPVPLEEPHPDRYQDGKYYCETCSRLFIGQYQWQKHYKSKGHRKQLYQSKLKLLHKKLLMLGKPTKCDSCNVFDDNDDELMKLVFISSPENYVG